MNKIAFSYESVKCPSLIVIIMVVEVVSRKSLIDQNHNGQFKRHKGELKNLSLSREDELLYHYLIILNSRLGK